MSADSAPSSARSAVPDASAPPPLVPTPTPAPRPCPECGTLAGTLARAPAPWWVRRAPWLLLALLLLSASVRVLFPGAFGAGPTLQSMRMPAPVGSGAFFAGDVRVGEVRRWASGDASGASDRLVRAVAEMNRPGRLVDPAWGLLVGISTGLGRAGDSERVGWPLAIRSDATTESFTDAPARGGRVLAPLDDHRNVRHERSGVFWRSELVTPHDDPTGGGGAYRSRSRSWLPWVLAGTLAPAAFTVALGVARTLSHRRADGSRPRAALLVALLAGVLLAASVVVGALAERVRSSVAFPDPKGVTMFGPSGVRVADALALLGAPDADVRVARSIAPLLPADVPDAAYVALALDQPAPMLMDMTDVAALGRTVLYLSTVRYALPGTPDAPLPMPAAQWTLASTEDTIFVQAPTRAGASHAWGVGVWVPGVVFALWAVLSAWWLGVLLRAAWVRTLTRRRRRAGACLACGYAQGTPAAPAGA